MGSRKIAKRIIEDGNCYSILDCIKEKCPLVGTCIGKNKLELAKQWLLDHPKVKEPHPISKETEFIAGRFYKSIENDVIVLCDRNLAKSIIEFSGVVIKQSRAPYHDGYSCNHWLKHRFQPVEVEITVKPQS